MTYTNYQLINTTFMRADTPLKRDGSGSLMRADRDGLSVVMNVTDLIYRSTKRRAFPSQADTRGEMTSSAESATLRC